MRRGSKKKEGKRAECFPGLRESVRLAWGFRFDGGLTETGLETKG